MTHDEMAQTLMAEGWSVAPPGAFCCEEQARSRQEGMREIVTAQFANPRVARAFADHYGDPEWVADVDIVGKHALFSISRYTGVRSLRARLGRWILGLPASSSPFEDDDQ